jgi:hypothetical protein
MPEFRQPVCVQCSSRQEGDLSEQEIGCLLHDRHWLSVRVARRCVFNDKVRAQEVKTHYPNLFKMAMGEYAPPSHPSG